MYTASRINKQVLPLQFTSDKKKKHVLYMQDPRDDGVGHFADKKSVASRELATQQKRAQEIFL